MSKADYLQFKAIKEAVAPIEKLENKQKCYMLYQRSFCAIGVFLKANRIQYYNC